MQALLSVVPRCKHSQYLEMPEVRSRSGASASADSRKVASIAFYKLRSPFARLDAFPFALLYPVLLAVWISSISPAVPAHVPIAAGMPPITVGGEWATPWLALMPVAGALHALLWLTTIWSVGMRCTITCSSTRSLETATHVKVVPTVHNGVAALVPLHRTVTPTEERYAFLFQKRCFEYNADKHTFSKVKVAMKVPLRLARRRGSPARVMCADVTMGTLVVGTRGVIRSVLTEPQGIHEYRQAKGLVQANAAAELVK